jgi:sulfur-carrier protein
MIRVVLPTQLRNLANVDREIDLLVEDPASLSSVLDALEARFPMLCGTIRDQVTLERRPFIRFFACGEDLSHESLDSALPHLVASGAEPLRIVGAMAGG